MPEDTPADDRSHPDSKVHKDPSVSFRNRSDSPEAARFSEGEEEGAPGDEHVGDFAEGEAEDADAHKRQKSSFAEGEEQLPPDEHTGSFAEGEERGGG